MKTALIQMNSSSDMAANIASVSAYIELAADNGAQLIVTPETTHLMVMGREKALALSHYESDDPGLQALQSSAQKANVWLLIGSLIIKKTSDRLVNRSYLIDPAGKIFARYDKMHLFDVDLGEGEKYQESALYDAGTQSVVANTSIGRIGMTICYDLRFPALFHQLATGGADIITVPAAFTVPTGRAHWQALLRARAIETGAWILAPAQTGDHDTGRSTWGHSLVIDPWGEIISDAGQAPGVSYVEINLQKCEEARKRVPSLLHGKAIPALKSTGCNE